MANSILYLILLGLVAATLLFFVRSASRPITDIWVINLDKDADRLKNIYAKGAAYKDSIHRWSATQGKTVASTDAYAEGVSWAMSGTKEGPVTRNAGQIGCWLSHKRLLQYLSKRHVQPDAGHLILEDDADLPVDLFAHWEAVKSQVPANYDIVYFGLHNPAYTQKTKNVGRLRTLNTDSGNWGTHAYMVRHGAIPRILHKLQHMTNEIDLQYNSMFDTLHAYVLIPQPIEVYMPLAVKSSVLEN